MSKIGLIKIKNMKLFENYKLKIMNHLLKIRNCKLKIVFFALILFLLMANNADAATLSKAPNNLGLVGYWTFNEGTSTVALDYSGNKNKGTLTGGSTWVNGKQGKALNFDGGNDYVDMGDPASGILDFGTGDFTVSVWAKSSNYLTGRGIVSKGLYWTSPGPGYTITHISNPLRVYFNTYDGTTQAYISSGIGPTYDWTHFVGVRRGANIEFWVNGSRVGTAVAPTGSLSNASSLTIGSGPNGNWSGTADEVRIYNRALTAGEIMKLYNTGR